MLVIGRVGTEKLKSWSVKFILCYIQVTFHDKD